eukprot:5747024-Amphidinium_carterae.1
MLALSVSHAPWHTSCEENPATIQVKVTDFGLAVIVDPETGFIIHRQPQATRWCSPEMIAHHKLSHLADVWGAGATIWEMFANGEMSRAEQMQTDASESMRSKGLVIGTQSGMPSLLDIAAVGLGVCTPCVRPWVKRKKREDVGARLRALAENHGAPEGHCMTFVNGKGNALHILVFCDSWFGALITSQRTNQLLCEFSRFVL